MLHTKKLNTSDYENVYIVPDIHGNLPLLMMVLKELNFSKRDLIIGLGDLIDRGPRSFDTLYFFNNTPNAISLWGNHEDMAATAILNRKLSNMTHWYHNGGEWAADYPSESLVALITQAKANMPIIIELSHKDKKLALTHAAMLENYDEIKEDLTPSTIKHLIWKHHRDIKDIAPGDNHNIDNLHTAKGVDVTIHGHTVIQQPLVVGNSIYLDCGAYGEQNFEERYGLSVLHLSKNKKAKLYLMKSNRHPIHPAPEFCDIAPQTIKSIRKLGI